MTDALGRVTQLEYDALGRQIKQIDPAVDGISPVTTFQYDQSGSLVATTDPLGQVSSYQYDHWGRLLSTTLPDTDPADGIDALALSQTYDDAGRIVTETDSAGRTTSYAYDGRGNLIQTTYPDLDGDPVTAAPSTRTDYDLAGQVIASYDTLGHQTRYEYDALGRNIAVILPAADGSVALDGTSADGPITQSVYNDAGNLIESIDPLGRVTSFAYDDWGREILRTLPDPDGSGPLPSPTQQTVYDDAGNVFKTIDHLGRETVTLYDRLDRPTITTFPDPDGTGGHPAPTYSTAYDKVGGVISETDAAGRTTTYQYDALGRLSQTTLPDPDPTDSAAAPTTSQTYDLIGNVLTRTDEDGATATWTYDALGQTTSETFADPDPNDNNVIAPKTTFTYDDAGNLSSQSVLIRENQWLTTTYTYDAWNRQQTVTAPEGDVTTYDYDTSGNLLSLTDASGNETSYGYDALGQQIRSTNENGDSRHYVYDDAGRLNQRTDRNGRVTQYTHDDLDRILSETWIENDSDGDTTIVSTYNDAGLLASIGDGHSNDTYLYDNGDRLTSQTRSGSGLTAHATFAYTYTAGGQLDTVTQSVVANDDVITDYDYDGAGRISQVTQSGNSLVTKSVSYDRSDYGQVIGLQRFAGGSTTPAVETIIDRDAIGRRTGIQHRQGTSVLADYTYTYDALSRVTSVDSLTDGLTTIELDDNGRLTSADNTDLPGGPVRPDESFAYDDTGNRIDADNIIDFNNKLTDDGTFTYEYDAEGNRTAKVDKANGTRIEFTYDFRNRLTWAKTYDGSGTLLDTAQYQYDAGNHRIGRAIDADGDGTAETIERFVVDGDTVTALVNAQGQIANQYFHGAAVDEVLADENAAGEVTWTLADSNKTIRDLARDVAGATEVVNHRVYDSFGNLQSQSDASIDHLFGFTGRDADEHTGLHYYRDRWMDPVAGLFLTEDPIGFDGGDVNLSNYVGGAPYDYTDPTGNGWLSDTWKKIKRESRRVVNQVADVVSEAFDDIGDFLEEAWDDTRDFVEDHPYISAGLALATGTWFVSAAGGFAGAAAKIGALATKAVGSVSTAWTPASSGIGGTFSVNVGSFASLNVGAGISGTSLFASANVSVLGLPVVGVGKSVGALGKISDPFASTLVGNFSDTLSTNILSGTGSTDVGSFLQSVGKTTASNFVNGQFAQTGIPTAIGVANQTAQFVGDAYGAFQDVFAPPPPPVQAKAYFDDNEFTPLGDSPDGATPLTDPGSLRRLPSDIDSFATRMPNSSEGGGFYDPYFATAELTVYGQLRPVDLAFDQTARNKLKSGSTGGSGHHRVPWEIITDSALNFPQEVQEFFDSDCACTRGKWFNTHDGRTQDGVTHNLYNQSVRDEMTTYLRRNRLTTLNNRGEAAAFLKHIDSLPARHNIAKFNRFVQIEADSAFALGEAIYKEEKAKQGFFSKMFYSDDVVRENVLKKVSSTIRGTDGTAANKLIKRLSAAGHLSSKVARTLARPLAITATVYGVLSQGDASAAGVSRMTAAFTGVDLPVEAGRGLAIAVGRLTETGQQTTDHADARYGKWSLGSAQKETAQLDEYYRKYYPNQLSPSQSAPSNSKLSHPTSPESGPLRAWNLR